MVNLGTWKFMESDPYMLINGLGYILQTPFPDSTTHVTEQTGV